MRVQIRLSDAERTALGKVQAISILTGRKAWFAIAAIAVVVTAQLAPVVPAVAATSPSPVTRLSKLPWPSGAYASQSTSGITSFGTYRGRAADISYVAAPLPRDGASIGTMTSATWMYDNHKGYDGWLSLGFCLVGSGGNWATGANGGYDANWQAAANNLKNSGFANRTVIRLDWEFNINHCSAHDTDLATFKSYWNRVAKIFKTTNPGVKLEWTPTSGGSSWSALGGDARNGYPGDQYVDFIGTDFYDVYPPARDEASWAKQRDKSDYGLTVALAFARSHNKLLSVPEWGIGNGSQWGSNSGGDNPFYIQKMYEWFLANAQYIAYEMYFNEAAEYMGSKIYPPLSGGRNGSPVQASAKYAALWKNAPSDSGTTPATPTPVTQTPGPSTPAPTGTNLAAGKSTVSSAGENVALPGNPPSYAVDGNEATRWVSAAEDNVSLTTDLGAAYKLGQIKILWAGDTTKGFDIQTSLDGQSWTTVKSGSTTNQAKESYDATLTGTTARYVRILGKDRWGARFGHSIYELAVYGATSGGGKADPKADINGDGKVNVQDLSYILSHWLP